MILILTYGLNLVFSLMTHKDLFNPEDDDASDERPGRVAGAAATVAVVLLVATAFVAWMSEILVGAVEEASQRWG